MNKIVPVLILVIVVTMWFVWPINAPSSHPAATPAVEGAAASGASDVTSSGGPVLRTQELGQPASTGPRASE